MTRKEQESAHSGMPAQDRAVLKMTDNIEYLSFAKNSVNCLRETKVGEGEGKLKRQGAMPASGRILPPFVAWRVREVG